MGVLKRGATLLSCRNAGLWMNTRKRCLDIVPSPNVLSISKEVQHALKTHQPVVALESTIITHGMPYPENLRTALEVEEIVRKENVTPATVGVINGKISVGLDRQQLEFLAALKTEAVKVSRRDFPYVVSKGLSGGTTVAGTMIAAYLAGISIFVTGGIGGVHRGAAETFDVSADLTELGRTPVAVICAGVKSILDIGLTLEYLETEGVPVVSFGKSKEFPAFFTRKSGFQAPYSSESVEELAGMIESNHRLGLKCGMLIGIPIPEDQMANGEEIEQCIQKALEEARAKGVVGKDVTPFVLENLNKMTAGRSLAANVALIKNNAKIGAKIALALAKSNQPGHDFYEKKTRNVIVKSEHKPITDQKETIKRPVIIGGCNFDLLCKTFTFDVVGEATNPGKLFQSFGGVGRNIAECLARLGSHPLLISAVGEDTQGRMMLEDLQVKGVDTAGIMTSFNNPTACYAATVNSAGELILGVGDMDIHQSITADYISTFEQEIREAPLVCLDANISSEAIGYTLELCSNSGTPVWFEPTCVEKARKPFTTDFWSSITIISPNQNELRTINAAVRNTRESHTFYSDGASSSLKETEILKECAHLCIPILERIPCITVTLGKNGVLIGVRGSLEEAFRRVLKVKNKTDSHKSAQEPCRFFHYAAAPKDRLPLDIKSVSGAGDSFAGAMIYALLSDKGPDISIKTGLYAACLSLDSHATISGKVDKHQLSEKTIKDWGQWQAREIIL